ncbi:hypothetical protein FRC07_008691, partial [Ceratobasidium sp. 392]
MELYFEARNILKDVVNTSREIQDPEIEAFATEECGYTAERQGFPQLAMECYQRALGIFKEHGEGKWIANENRVKRRMELLSGGHPILFNVRVPKKRSIGARLFKSSNFDLRPSNSSYSFKLECESIRKILEKEDGAVVKAINTNNLEKVKQHISHELGQQAASKAPENGNRASPATTFESKYTPGAENAFCAYLKRCNEAFRHPSWRYYGKFCSIVQSSGTGKSRTLIELKEKGVVVIYLNIRNEQETNAYPPRDTIPADILTRQLGCSKEDYTDRCVAFFTAMFKALKARLEEYSRSRSSREDIISAWSLDTCKIGSKSRANFFERLRSEYDKGPQLLGEVTMTNAYRSLLSIRPRIFNSGTNTPQLVVAIDEAHTLWQPQRDYVPSHILYQVISVLSTSEPDMSSWVAFASTTSDMTSFSVETRVGDSLRISGSGHLLFPPYSLLDWDQRAPEILNIEPENVAQFKHIVGFGRP